MTERSRLQLPSAVLMVRPARFGFNPETSLSNTFQHEDTQLTRSEIQRQARKEFNLMTDRLDRAGVSVIVVEDTDVPAKPDAVFPNNWISLHQDGTVVLYPMASPLRRLERRGDVTTLLEKRGFVVRRVIDLTEHEKEGRFLEGTGSIVFDHAERCAYANISPRTDPDVLEQLCAELQYARITFHAVDVNGQDIYHTNVMMSIGDQFAVLCAESIRDGVERKLVCESLTASGREIILISPDQLTHFCGNILQLQGRNGPVIAMSNEACLAFTPGQRTNLEKYGQIVESPITLIERIEGGSARCMIAGIHLPRPISK
jgi:hypothetical protein